jgi:hypothetical protein
MNDYVVSELHTGIAYDYKLGVFYRLVLQENNIDPVLYTDDEGKTYTRGRLVIPTIDGFLVYTDIVSGKKNIKLKAIRVAYEMFYNCKRPKGMIVYHKDMVEGNYRVENIGTIPVELWQDVKDALYNVQDGIKIKPHPSVAYSFVLSFRQNGRIVRRVKHDITQVLQYKRKILLKCSKLVSKYTVTN